MTIAYDQVAQARENSTNAVSVYAGAANTEVQCFVTVCNTTSGDVLLRLFHDKDGTTYDENTALVWDVIVEPGQVFDKDKIFINGNSGNLAYRSSVANALTITVYGVNKS